MKRQNTYWTIGLSALATLGTTTHAEVNFNIANYKARAFGDFAYNSQGNDRARAAATAAGPNVLPRSVGNRRQQPGPVDP